MNFKGMKWLNFILTAVALLAIYIFLDGRLEPALNNILTGALAVIGLVSFVPVMRDFKKNDNNA